MITRGCTGSFYPSHKTSLHRESGEQAGRELVAGKKKTKGERPRTNVEEGGKRPRISVSTADLIGFIRGKCVRPGPCNPFFALVRLNRKPSGPLSLLNTTERVSERIRRAWIIDTAHTAFHNLP